MPGEQFASWVNSGNATENEKLDSAAFRAGSISLTTKEEINEQETRRSGGDEKCLSKRMIFFSSCLGVSVFLLDFSSRFDESLGLKKPIPNTAEPFFMWCPLRPRVEIDGIFSILPEL